MSEGHLTSGCLLHTEIIKSRADTGLTGSAMWPHCKAAQHHSMSRSQYKCALCRKERKKVSRAQFRHPLRLRSCINNPRNCRALTLHSECLVIDPGLTRNVTAALKKVAIVVRTPIH